uniref:Coiled-coil domain-containing protein 86 n=1 Tax=Ananas comosus var. bracteatus TaxID=296719 RepID=A0A6V7Q074_ANACO|nr:unnamed protein product [Ananas comosus var. bracteatus]
MASGLDFRFLDEGLGGAKNKRKRVESEVAQDRDDDGRASSSMDLDAGGPPPWKRAALPSLEDPDKPASFGRPTYDGVIAGRVSGRKWKQARAHRASAVAASRRGKSLELRTIEKETKRAYRERMAELKEKIRQSKESKRKAREEREKRKQENILRSGTKLQKITNPKTLKKIAKSKDRKLLKVVPDELLSKKKKKKKED